MKFSLVLQIWRFLHCFPYQLPKKRCIPKPIQARSKPNRTSKYRNKILNFKTAGLRSSNFKSGSSLLNLALAFLLLLKIVLDWDLNSYKKRTLKFNLLLEFSDAEINEFDKKNFEIGSYLNHYVQSNQLKKEIDWLVNYNSDSIHIFKSVKCIAGYGG